MSLLVGNGLAKSYGANDVFSQIDLRIEHSDRIGLVGPNGSGKSSLLKVLARLERDDGGEIYVARETRIGYLPQDPPPAGERTLYEDLHSVFDPLIQQGVALQQMEERMTDPDASEAELETLLVEYGRMQEAFERAGGYEIDQRVATVLSGLGFSRAQWDQPLTQLSGGQRTRALLGRLLLERPDLLLLDEPTNHLDVNSVEWLESELQSWDGALVVVSHDRYFLDTVVTRVWELSHSRLESYRGNYTHYRQQRAERLDLWQKEYAKQQKFIRETEEFVRKYKAGQRTKEAQGRETRLKRFLEEEALSPPPNESRIRLPLQTDLRSGDLVMRTQNLVVGYPADDGGPGIPILNVPNLDLLRGNIVALVGPNGSGKTTLVRTLLGNLEPIAGKIRLGEGVEIGYLAQRHVGRGAGLMDANQTVLDALLSIQNLPLERARTYLGQFLFKGDDVFKKVGTLSGGQRSRIALARLTLQGANFLLLDEPTNHLDLDSQEILQAALKDFIGTILLVTHDRALVDALASELWLVEPGPEDGPAQLIRFRGTWRQWLQERTRRRSNEELRLANSQKREANTTRDDRERQREARRRRQAEDRQAQELAEQESRIQKMEQRLVALEEEMASASLAQDVDRLRRYSAEHEALRQRLEKQMEIWSRLADQVSIS